jgi:hypothetical protein
MEFFGWRDFGIAAAKSRAVSLNELLKMGIEVTEALETAHRGKHGRPPRQPLRSVPKGNSLVLERRYMVQTTLLESYREIKAFHLWNRVSACALRK